MHLILHFQINQTNVSAIFVYPPTQRGESIITTVRYGYTVKPTADGGLITRAHGLERQLFSPFNVKGGNFKMEAM